MLIKPTIVLWCLVGLVLVVVNLKRVCIRLVPFIIVSLKVAIVSFDFIIEIYELAGVMD